MHLQEKGEPRLIKRYGNRKMYDVQTSQYITLDGIKALVQAGEDVRVVDNETGEDLTRVTFAQIIYEEEKRRNGVLSLPMLRWLVERGDEAIRDLRRSVERGREAWDNVVEATEKRVQEFVERSSDRGRTLLEEILSAPQRQLDQLQQRIDQQVEKVTSHPKVQKELKRIEQNIRHLERRLSTLGRGQREPAKRQGAAQSRGRKKR